MSEPLDRLSAPALAAARAIDSDRLWQRHEAMAGLGAIPGNGVNRPALSADDIVARRLLLDWADARFEVGVDSIGNLFLRRAGTEPGLAPILSGSHMDSQPSGGRFDGIYGVLAALEVLEALESAGVKTRRPVELVAWTNEEGGRFAPGAMGSMVFTGSRRLEDCLDVQDADGIVLRDALAETLAATPEAEVRDLNFPVAGYVEAHIEQGPRLEEGNLSVGVVTGIQGSRWFEVNVHGDLGHAGTAPLESRRDAVQGALAVVQALNDLTHDPSDTVRFTVGRFDVSPNSPNTVANHVSFSIDLRHPDADVLTDLGDRVEATCCGAAGPCDVTVKETFHRMPCVFAESVVSAVGTAARDLDISCMHLPSGAFHDAQFMNDVCPTGMIFVPCEKGISHSPAENAKPEDLAAGGKVLAAALVELACV